MSRKGKQVGKTDKEFRFKHGSYTRPFHCQVSRQQNSSSCPTGQRTRSCEIPSQARMQCYHGSQVSCAVHAVPWSFIPESLLSSIYTYICTLSAYNVNRMFPMSF